MTFSITKLWHNAECHYDECRVLLIIILNVIMLNVIMQIVVAPFHASSIFAGNAGAYPTGVS